MKIDRNRFSVPFSALEEAMPSKQRVLLFFLFMESDIKGACSPGYEAMKAIIRDEEGQKGCNSTVRRYIKDLQKRGWIHFTKRTNGRMGIWLQIPARYRRQKPPASLISVVSR